MAYRNLEKALRAMTDRETGYRPVRGVGETRNGRAETRAEELRDVSAMQNTLKEEGDDDENDREL